MWIPASVDDIESAITSGILQERTVVEIKRALPPSGKNVDVAVDVAAMATSGGTLIYGIGENAHGRPEKDPIVLAGARDRVASIVQSSVAESPTLDIRELPLPNDPSRGYLAVHVPPSPYAPHMVQVKGEFRYYGRNEGGNYILPHDQVVALIERRRRWERAWQVALDEAIGLSPDFSDLQDFVPLDLIFLPLLGGPDVFERAFPDGAPEFLNDVTSVRNSLPFAEPGGFSISAVISSGPLRRVNGWLIYREPEGEVMSPMYACQLEVGDAGLVRYSWAAVAHTSRRSTESAPQQYAMDHAIAQVVAQVALLAGRIYRRAGYSGPVDAAVSIRNASGVVSSKASYELLGQGSPYAPMEYRRGERFPASALEDDPREVALKLVGPWLWALRQMDPRRLLKLRNE